MKRSRKRGIPVGTKCDAYTGMRVDRCGAPVIERCKNLATRIVKTNKLWLCDFHRLWLCDFVPLRGVRGLDDPPSQA